MNSAAGALIYAADRGQEIPIVAPIIVHANGGHGGDRFAEIGGRTIIQDFENRGGYW